MGGTLKNEPSRPKKCVIMAAWNRARAPTETICRGFAMVICRRFTLTQEETAYAQWCAAQNPHAFYIWSRWLHIRQEVLALDHGECQICRSKYHRYRMATTVHHVNHFKRRPDLALEIWADDPVTHKRERNLISLCHDCHEEVHAYRAKNVTKPLTEERWD